MRSILFLRQNSHFQVAYDNLDIPRDSRFLWLLLFSRDCNSSPKKTVRGHRTGSNNSEAEDYLGKKKVELNRVRIITEAPRTPQTKKNNKSKTNKKTAYACARYIRALYE